MDAMTNVELADGYATYRPAGQTTLADAIALVTQAIAQARDLGVTKLLVDTTALEGLGTSVSTWDRFRLGEEWARAAHSRVIVAFVARSELIDARRFGVTVARNRGLMSSVFASEDEALAWLLDPERA